MPIRILLRAALAVICLLGATASVITYVSQSRLQDAVIAVQRPHQCGRVLGAIRASDSPLNPSAYRDVILAACLVDTGHPREADRTIAAVTARQPGNAQVWVTVALLQFGRGRLAAARASYSHARALDPHLPPASF